MAALQLQGCSYQRLSHIIDDDATQHILGIGQQGEEQDGYQTVDSKHNESFFNNYKKRLADNHLFAVLDEQALNGSLDNTTL